MAGPRAAKRQALGRGLGALIPGGPDYTAPASGKAPRDFMSVAVEQVHPNPKQPRKTFDDQLLDELAQSIREEGIIQPLIVQTREEGEFVIIAGERRWRAAQRAGLREVPVVVRNVTDAKAFEMALVENVQRADLNAIEEAEAYQHLVDDLGNTQEQVAQRVGKDRATVANALRLLKLPLAVRGLVQDEKLSMGHARALLGLDDDRTIEVTAQKVVARGLSVRATEELVRGARRGPQKADTPVKSANTKDLERKLAQAIGGRVTIQDRGGQKGGKLVIGYADLNDLDRLLERLLALPKTGKVGSD